MTAFDQFLHTIIVRGEQEARDDGSSTVEAQHLLLAIAVERESSTQRVLGSAGLDHGAVRDALEREFEHSLNAVGVSRTAYDLPRPSRPPNHPKLGSSAKLAIERCMASVAKKKARPANLLLGILLAQVGTVPRALALAGVDRTELIGRVRQALDTEGE
jgi:D-alanyl-D-alanine carboxypeptidase